VSRGTAPRPPGVDEALARLASGRLHAPFDVLGWLPADGDAGRGLLRVWAPGARRVAVDQGPELGAADPPGVWEWSGPSQRLTLPYRLNIVDGHGRESSLFDPYAFKGGVGEADAHYFNEGTHLRLYEMLGARPLELHGVAGVRFALWAPNAERVSVVGDFNGWEGHRHPMQSQGASGLWWLFLPGVTEDACYKFEIVGRDGVARHKADPFARAFELRPRSASRVHRSRHEWADEQWMAARRERQPLAAPVSVYEVHLGSWQRRPDGSFNDYRTLARSLADYVTELGFTHVELLPITEHPFDGSWGYQTLGYFAPTSRFGSPDDFKWFVDHLHQRGVGVLLDWVPAHFPRDAHGLARFDGTALFEHEDPRRGEHPDWDTLIFNYGRKEVANFLTASALFWLREYHLDGLRVDAVASMLYLDYSRPAGQWLPNPHGGRENLDAIAWLRRLNEVAHDECPGTLMIAEESTAWPQVTSLTSHGGLGFTLKWNMGWMHDTLVYLSKDPIHRVHHHDLLTFGMLYAYSENYLLPLSHDEVVHGKGALLRKMPGDRWQQFANLRLLYCFQFTYPGKKLLFMGDEFGQPAEWNHDGELDWPLLTEPAHRQIQDLVKRLNGLYRHEPALGVDHQPEGFRWLSCEDGAASVLAYLRRSGDDHCVVVLNLTPVPRPRYRVGVPQAVSYEVLLNSDDPAFGGSGWSAATAASAGAEPWHGQDASVELDLPPLAALLLRPVRTR